MGAKKTCVIIGAAPNTSLDFLDVSDKFVIATDGGYLTAKKSGIRVDYFIGDLDSAKISESDIDVACDILPCEKDYSDMHVALDFAISRGYDDIVIVGALGGRCDHLLANLALLEHAALSGVHAVIKNEWNEITCLLPGEYEIARRDGRYLSLIALDREVKLSLSGLKYPLCDATLLRHVPIAISNEWCAPSAKIKVSGGAVLLLFSGDEK